MVIDKNGNTTIVSQEHISISEFVNNITAVYADLENENIVVNLFAFSELTANQIMEFQQLSDKHRAAKHSFVVVTEKVTYDEVPETICLVPSIQEAMDFIGMEEIERDLGL